jgi:hypothetical protein
LRVHGRRRRVADGRDLVLLAAGNSGCSGTLDDPHRAIATQGVTPPMTSLDASPRASRPIDWGRYALVGIATVIAAVAANLVVYFIGSALVRYDPGFVVLATPGGTIIFTVVPAIVAVIVYALLLRFSPNPERVFTIVAAVVLILSWIPDLTYIPTVPGSSPAQTAVLMVMHVVAAVVIVTMLTNLARPRPV